MRSSRHSRARRSSCFCGMLVLRSPQAAQLPVDLGGLVLQAFARTPVSVIAFC